MTKLDSNLDIKTLISKVPKIVITTAKVLEDAGYDAYLVGGCVRDLILNKTPKDWDLTTNATPEQIQALYPKTFYENSYGTVGVVNEGIEDKTLEVIEITPYRVEAEYKDSRHPSSVTFSTNIHDDLKRRDFTVNAIALSPLNGEIVDDFAGLKDIEYKTLRTVGDADARLTEDGLRILRAIRLAAELSFTINKETEEALISNGHILEKIALERIRDEFIKITMTNSGAAALFMLQKLGLLKYVIPELEEGVHMKQNTAHSFEVFEHLLRSYQCAIDKGYSLEMRVAALLHDIGKPRSRRFSEETGQPTFYGHEVIGAKMTRKILERLRFQSDSINLIEKLVRWHMFFSDTNQITHSAVRRMIANVGQDQIWNLINLRICDRVGTGKPKEDPYRLRKYISMIEEVLRDPISVSMLKINGNDIINDLGIPPGPMIGFMLNILLEEVMEDPSLNTREYLVSRITELSREPFQTLKDRSKEAVAKKDMAESSEIESIQKKHRV